MSDNIIEQTRALHEDVERLEHAAVDFLLEEPRTYKESVNQSHKVSQVLDLINSKKNRLIEIYKDVDDSRKNGIESLAGDGDALFSEFYDKLRDVKDYHRRFPGIPISDPAAISSQIHGSSEVQFSAEECHGKYLDLHRFHDLYNNLPWIKGKPVDYFEYLKRAYAFGESLSGKGSKYLDYLKELYEYTTDHITRSQPLYDLDDTLRSFNQEFDALWENKQRDGETKPLTNEEEDELEDEEQIISRTYCLDCLKKFAKSSVFNGHLLGKKHKKSIQRSKPLEKETFLLEYKLQRLGEYLQDQIASTKIHVETKLARRYEDIAADFEDDEAEPLSGSDTDEEEEMTRRCITNYPVGWDGKPIPYWLYKLHGLGIEYKCEICGNTSYWGRRNFERHFQEYRHSFGMKCLGIPNTKHFNDITNINDALALWEKVKVDQRNTGWNPEENEEFEDAEGNVMIKKTYLDLKRQGLAK